MTIRKPLSILLLCSSLAACGGGSSSGAPPAPQANTPPVTQLAPASPPVQLLDQNGDLAATDPVDGQSYSDRYQLAVQAGDRIAVDLTSTTFDPMLEVSPPNGGSLTNDDWQGSREHSHLDLVAAVAGELKVTIKSYAPQATGAYHVTVTRRPTAVALNARAAPAGQLAQAVTASPGGAGQTVPVANIVQYNNPQAIDRTVLAPGQSITGELANGDATFSDGSLQDTVLVTAMAETVNVSVSSPGGQRIRALVTNPSGQAIQPAGNGQFVLPQGALYRVHVIGERAGATAQWAVNVQPNDGSAVSGGTQPRGHHDPTGNAPGAALALGSDIRGELAQGDGTLTDGEFADTYTLPGLAGLPLSFTLESEAFDAYLVVRGPDGQQWENDDSGGSRNAALELTLPATGNYTVIATSYRAGMSGAYELKVQPNTRQGSQASVAQAPGAAGGASVSGTLAQGDATLRSGEFVDNLDYTFTAGTTVQLRLNSTDFDTYLIVRPPSGDQQDNDDITPDDRNSGLDYRVQITGTYRVMVTSYRAGETGAYTLTVNGPGVAAAGNAVAQPATPTPTPGTPTPTPAGPGQVVRGNLAQGDTTLSSGEFFDATSVTLPAGAHVRIDLSSSDFDTYLIVRGPDGHQQDNDDAGNNSTDSQLNFVTTAAGAYEIRVTSYRPGETGNYELRVGAPGAAVANNTPTPPTGGNRPPAGGNRPPAGGGTPAAAGQRINGALAASDSQLSSGEYFDVHRLQLTAGASVRLHVTSTAFDTYLIVTTPSGRQLDNDDVVSGDTNSAVDLPAAEAGTYEVKVTSYRAGETGAYVLTVEAGAVIPGPREPGQPVAAGAGGRVFGVFAGISDYPGAANDLPECANDARKMAEAFTNVGLMDASNMVVLTDGQVTRAALSDAIRRFGAQAGPNDQFVFFYSGHGGRGAPGSSSDPNEVDGADETLFLYDGELIDDQMGTLFDGIRARNSILALDSCFSGGFAKDVIRRPGRIGYFSSEEDVTSGVAMQFQAGGYLSHFLQTAIRGEADSDPSDRVLTVGELSHYLDRAFATQASDVRMGDAYQRLVIDRGAVGSDTVLWAFRR